MLALPDWPAWAMRTFAGLAGLTMCVGTLQAFGGESNKDEAKPSGKKLPAFRSFQRSYLVVYYIIMLADWLQGTNMYTLYKSYGVDISTLFITGFTSSAIFGTIIGLYVDKWGRKFGCIVYLLIEVVVNICEHFNNFPLLFASRVLGGVSTSLLFSAFESWMVSAHRKKGFPEEWLANTFSWMSFGNGIIAIVAGIVAQVLADEFGEIGPFQAAIAFTVAALFFVLFWEENYGGDEPEAAEAEKTNGKKNGNQEKKESVGTMALIMRNKSMMLFGLVNSLFEGAMYSFVFMWVPTMFGVLSGAPLPTGLVFACLMACIALGGLLFSSMLRFTSVEYGTIGVFLVGALALCVPVMRNDLISVLGSFLVFETCVGMFFPCAGFLRSKVIPDSAQTSVMNVFRVPLNILVVVGTKMTDLYPTSTCFTVVVCWLLLGALLQCALARSMGGQKVEKNKKQK